MFTHEIYATCEAEQFVALCKRDLVLYPRTQRDPLTVAATGRHSQDETGPEGSEGSPPTDGPGAARAVDPNYCSKCAPKDLGLCICNIACNE